MIIFIAPWGPRATPTLRKVEKYEKGDDTSFVFKPLPAEKKTTKEKRISLLFYLFYGPFGEPIADILFSGTHP